MTFPILTPEIHGYIQAYCVATIVVFSLSTSSLASRLQGPPRRPTEIPWFMVSHVALLATVALFAATMLGIPKLLPGSLTALAGLTCLGVALGFVALLANRAIVRAMTTSRQIRPPPEIRTTTLPLRVLTAFFEEILYRGYLVTLCQEIPNIPLSNAALAATVFAFALAHSYAGLPNPLAKLPLGIIALALVLTSGALLPAILTHVVFNIFSIDPFDRELQKIGNPTRSGP
jgi:membrane protease YdiL (CAAX protease family)